jgi:Ca2+-binding EF-hand superfamily protein
VIDFDEFVEAMASQQEDDETGRQLQELQDVFSLFDSDGSGLLSADEVRRGQRGCCHGRGTLMTSFGLRSPAVQLQRALKILGVSLSRAEVELLMREIDANGDGEISCDELLQYVLAFDDGDSEVGGDVEQGRRR